MAQTTRAVLDTLSTSRPATRPSLQIDAQDVSAERLESGYVRVELTLTMRSNDQRSWWIQPYWAFNYGLKPLDGTFEQQIVVMSNGPESTAPVMRKVLVGAAPTTVRLTLAADRWAHRFKLPPEANKIRFAMFYSDRSVESNRIVVESAVGNPKRAGAATATTTAAPRE